MRPSIYAESRAKVVRPIQVAKHVSKQRMLSVHMNPPDEVGVRILQWILLAGDSRHWSWSATKRNANGLVRNSLAYELAVAKSHVKAALEKLLDDKVVSVSVKQDGREILHVTHLGKIIFTELEWRHNVRDWMPDLAPMADTYGWQELSVAVDRQLKINDMDPTKANIDWCSREVFSEGGRYA
jgi:hypothetical protein